MHFICIRRHPYWDWPYTADKTKTGERLLEMDRDWIWYKAWARYAWDSKRDRNEEIKYWDNDLADKFGTDLEAANNILKAYEEAGEIAPKTLRRFGITEGNRQTLLLGMFESQLSKSSQMESVSWIPRILRTGG